MVQVEGYKAPDSLLRPETQTDQERGEERIAQLQRAAENHVHEHDDLLRAADVEGNLFDSGFEARVVDRVPTVQARRIRNRIFNVLEHAGVSHEGVLGAGTGGDFEFSRTEAQIWCNTRENTLDAIRARGTGANTSLLAAEGFEKMLSTSVSQLESEWQAAEGAAMLVLNNRSFFEKMTQVRRKARFKKFSKKFKDNVKRQKERIKKSIDVVKARKKIEVRRAENTIKNALASATDPNRERLWDLIKQTVANPANAADRANDFHTTSGLPLINANDFLEAIQGSTLKLAEKVGKTRRSEALNRDAEDRLEDFHDRENRMGLAPDYATLQTTLNATLAVFPFEGNPGSTKDLAGSIEAGLIQQGVNILLDVYGNTQILNITNAEKLVRFLKYFETHQAELGRLDEDIKRKLLRYIMNARESTASDFERVAVLSRCDDQWEKCLADLQGLVNVPSTAGGPTITTFPRNLSNINTILNPNAFDQTIFNEAMMSFESSMQTFENNKAYFDQHKSELQDDHKTRLENLWKRLDRDRKRVKNVVDKWKEEVDKYEVLQDNLHSTLRPAGATRFGVPLPTVTTPLEITEDEIACLTAEIHDYNTNTNHTETVPTVGAGGTVVNVPRRKPSIDQALAVATANLARLQTARGKFTGFTFTNPNIFSGDLLDLGPLVSERPTLPTTAPDPTPNERIHAHINKEFMADMEQQYIQFLEKNSKEQWELLKDIPEGAAVKLSFRDTTNVSELTMPKDLHTKKEDVTDLRLIRKNSDGIVLESNDHVYVITGPSASGKKARSNIGKYQKVTSAGGAAAGMGGLGTPPPNFSVPHSNPNATGVILTMSIT